eukprot:jgi/Ulvmu1/3220/UM015_0261.1
MCIVRPADASADKERLPAAPIRSRIPVSRPKMSSELAPLFTRAVYDSVQQLGVMSASEFQAANFRLRDREYRYYFAANRDRLDRIPDLTDMSGGLSNPTYFNFVYYIAWKLVALNLLSSEERSRFNSVFGDNLLTMVAPESRAKVQQSRMPGSKSPPGTVRQEVERILVLLEDQGYAARSQVVWGQRNSDVPYRWEEVPEVSLCAANVDTDAVALSSFQVRLRQPADIEGSVSLRSEENGFWSRSVSSILQSLLKDAGYSSSVDEVFFQDEWQPPKSLKDRIVLFFGDPLMQVEVPWEPQSLIQNYTVDV